MINFTDLDFTLNVFIAGCVLFIVATVFLLLKKYKCKLDFILQYLAYISFSAFIFFYLPWFLINFYLRYAVILLSFVLLIPLMIRIRKLPFYIRKRKMMRIVGTCLTVIILAAGVYADAVCLMAYHCDEKPVELEFPFRNGSYTATAGGDGEKSPPMNYHTSNPTWLSLGYVKGMKYAADLIKIDQNGFFSDGIYPRDVSAYEIYGETIYSPCDGVIYDVVNDKDDTVPFTTPSDSGNRIVIQMGDYYILLCHMQKNSILVNEGDTVKAGQPIALVGNTGMTVYPHLHIQVTKDNWLYGEGVPIRFNFEILVRNRLIIAADSN